MTLSGIRARARAAALDVEELTPPPPEHPRVPVMTIAKRLGIAVETKAGLPARARWHQGPRLVFGDAGPEPVSEVTLKQGLRDSARRFAVAHEIGHIMLERRYPEEAALMPQQAREDFATAFASELLIPFSRRDEIHDRFRRADQPVALLRLSDALGISPKTVLRFARRERWLEGLDRIWLEVRYMPNLKTRRDPRLRVWLPFFDTTRWYVPRNRSIAGLCGSDEWLALTHGGRSSIAGTVELSWVTGRLWPKFETGDVAARLEGLRLAGRPTDTAAEFLVTANLKPT